MDKTSLLNDLQFIFSIIGLLSAIYFIIINSCTVFKMERYFICDIDNKKEWQHFKLKRCHSVGTA